MTSLDTEPQAPPDAPLAARMLGAVGRGLITAGVVVLLFVVFQLWGTNIQEARAQEDLRDEFDDTFAAARNSLGTDDPSPTPVVTDAGGRDDDPDSLPVPTSTLPGGLDPSVLAFFFPADGDAVARIEIPAIGVDKIVVNGVQVADLRKGPGQYDGSAAVGTEGNTSIAGHRTTYGAPFNRIDELQTGDEIHVTGILGRFTYRVMAPEVAFADQIQTVDAFDAGHILVRPSDTWVLGDFDDDRLTLTACHPKLSSRQRIIVAAELIDAPAAAPEFDPEVVAAFTGEPIDEPALPGEAFGTDDPLIDASGAASPSSLDEGLDGERGAIPGAGAWMVAATAFWVLGGIVGRRLSTDRRRRIGLRLVGLMPAAVCLWFSFEMIDRALPAG